MSAARRLVLWRHGQTSWNLERRFQGQTDIPLDETGIAQARQAAGHLASLKPVALFSSDLQRAQLTAATLAERTGLPVTLDKDLRERSGGVWEGLTDAEIRERYPAERATWNPPNGELTLVVADRVAGAFARIAESIEPGDLAIAVGHGASLRLGMERILGIAVGDLPTLGSLVNCSWSVLEVREGHWRLNEYNVTSPDVETLSPASFSDPTTLIPEAKTGDDN